ncbi:adenylyl cyclase-associated protein [Danaus plexippus plexippus]|uniref:Adenylyl cyclase-associated protein n=1 Tax=Danaus plexippus plexippus TaxID=278856 RepID=A0A212F1W2_DANPL|nr:adenylyl cyclase-associated protein [Danaus plexippus plexippus]
MDSLANSDSERRAPETDVIEKYNEDNSTDQTIKTCEKDESKDLAIHVENVLNDEKTDCEDKEECPDTPVTVETPNQIDEVNEISDEVLPKPYVTKRFSVDYKKNRIDIKRYSIDCSRNVTLDELASLEQELARTNVGVRLGPRRKSSGILKSTSESMESCDKRFKAKHDSASDDDEVFEKPAVLNDYEGPREPPATPVGRDELALRRHRFFSDLVCAARAAVEHRVRFDPLGPVVADSVLPAPSTYPHLR